MRAPHIHKSARPVKQLINVITLERNMKRSDTLSEEQSRGGMTTLKSMIKIVVRLSPQLSPECKDYSQKD